LGPFLLAVEAIEAAEGCMERFPSLEGPGVGKRKVIKVVMDVSF
jgi:hypothetical protein